MNFTSESLRVSCAVAEPFLADGASVIAEADFVGTSALVGVVLPKLNGD